MELHATKQWDLLFMNDILNKMFKELSLTKIQSVGILRVCLFLCPSQAIRVMLSVVSLPTTIFPGQD